MSEPTAPPSEDEKLVMVDRAVLAGIRADLIYRETLHKRASAKAKERRERERRGGRS